MREREREKGEIEDSDDISAHSQICGWTHADAFKPSIKNCIIAVR